MQSDEGSGKLFFAPFHNSDETLSYSPDVRSLIFHQEVRVPPRWTLITSHGSTLMLISRNQRITTCEIASRLGLTERSVLRIIKELEQEGYIHKQKVGRRNQYEVQQGTPMRRSDMHHVPVGQFLELMESRRMPIEPTGS